MKRLRIVLPIILAFGLSNSAYAAESWEGYPTFSNLSDVALFDNALYALAESGILRYDPSNEEYTTYHKNNGFNIHLPLTIAAGEDYLYIGCKGDGLFRFSPDDGLLETILFPEYVDPNDPSNTIALNEIVAFGDSILYVAHSRGIDRLNLVTRELRTYSKFTTKGTANIAVNDIAIIGDKLYACTAEGLSWATLSTGNLELPESWQTRKFPSQVTAVDGIDTTLYVGTNQSGVFTFNPVTFDTLYTPVINENIFDISTGENGTFVASQKGLWRFNGSSWSKYPIIEPLSAVLADNSVCWVASGAASLQCFRDTSYVDISQLNGPTAMVVYDMTIDNDGTLWASGSYRDTGGDMIRFGESTWTSYTYNDTHSIFWQVYSLEANHEGGIWLGPWGPRNYLSLFEDAGTPEKTDDTLLPLDPDDSALPPRIASNHQVAYGDITTDEEGRLWIAAWDQGVFVLDGKIPAGDYRNRHLDVTKNGVTHYIYKVVSKNGWAWLGTWQTGLIAVWFGNDPYITSLTPLYITSGTTSGTLNGTRIKAIVVDDDGYVWVGTDSGLNRITVGSGHTVSSLTITDRTSLLGLTSVEVSSLELDSYNTLWVGTTEGLFRLDDNRELVARYDSDNSGLFADTISALKFDTTSDALWVGTEFGLNRFLLNTSEGEKLSSHVYPNPFQYWGTTSKATIHGLEPSSKVRIYTFTGDLVTELEPGESDGEGGEQVQWDGRNMGGGIVGTGVYLVVGNDRSGQVFREKLALIRR